MIDRPDVYCGVLHRIGDTVIRRMQSEEAFALLGGSLTVTVGVSVVNGNFDIDGGAVALIIGA